MSVSELERLERRIRENEKLLDAIWQQQRQILADQRLIIELLTPRTYPRSVGGTITVK